MKYRVRLNERAFEDLDGIRAWIESEAGVDIADAYSGRLRAFMAKLIDFPKGGTPRDDLRAGVRSLVFEHTLIVFHRIDGTLVTILRIVHGARDQAMLLEP